MNAKNQFETDRGTFRKLVRGAYDIQKLRIATGNRLTATFRARLGVEPGKADDKVAGKVLKEVKRRYKRLADAISDIEDRSKFGGDNVISTWHEFILVTFYVDLEAQEERYFKRFERLLGDFEIWNQFLVHVSGCGRAMAGVIISEIDIYRAEYPSSLSMYAGLDMAEDGRGRSRRAEHQVKRTYTDKDGEEKERNSITFNPFLKTKMIGVLADCLIRAQGGYYDIYWDYKHRLESRVDLKEESKGRRHNMAKRYMIKRFLADLYNAWRPLEGLPVAPTYHEAKLGHVHGKKAA